MLSKKLKKYLEANKIKHEIVKHKVVYTAYDAAATMKVKLHEIAKSLLVKFNRPFLAGEKPYAMVIVPADKNIDLKKLGKVVSDWAVKLNKELRFVRPQKGKPASSAGKKQIMDLYSKVVKVIIPKEKEMKDKLKAKPGALSAFGGIYRLPVFIDKTFLKGKLAIFAGDSFVESVKMAVKDFYELEKAMAGNFSVKRKFKKK